MSNASLLAIIFAIQRLPIHNIILPFLLRVCRAVHELPAVSISGLRFYFLINLISHHCIAICAFYLAQNNVMHFIRSPSQQIVKNIGLRMIKRSILWRATAITRHIHLLSSLLISCSLILSCCRLMPQICVCAGFMENTRYNSPG